MQTSTSHAILPTRFQPASAGQARVSLRRLAQKLLGAAVVAVSVASLTLVGGCEGSSSGGGKADVVGTWSLTNGGSTWYILFASDNTWKISDTADGSKRRVFGTYTVSGDTVTGDMQNPGVGTGQIKATLSGDSIALDFIEHWHTPYKVVPYTGSRLK